MGAILVFPINFQLYPYIRLISQTCRERHIRCSDKMRRHHMFKVLLWICDVLAPTSDIRHLQGQGMTRVPCTSGRNLVGEQH
jgi:hypothetical protein